MQFSSPESPSNHQPATETDSQELAVRLTEIKKELDAALDAQEKVEADLQRLTREFERLETIRYELITESMEIERTLYPDVFE